jgi:hypothetical protein
MELGKVMDESTDYRKKENRDKLLDLLPIEENDFGGVKIHKSFFVDLLQYDVYEKAEKYPGKVLILRGALDDLLSTELQMKN